MTKGGKRSRPKGGRKIVAHGTPARWEVAWHPKALDEKVGYVKAVRLATQRLKRLEKAMERE